MTMALMHIGELARRTRLSVKTVRYYSDLGLVAEAARTSSGYRCYDGGAVFRLEYVRTLRELGLDLATIRRVLDRETDLSTVAAAHAEALSAQIRLLRVQRAALRTVARRHQTPAESNATLASFTTESNATLASFTTESNATLASFTTESNASLASFTKEIEHMNRLAQATADERRRLINEFLDSIFEGVNVTSEFESRMRHTMPDLPDEPSDEQMDAWLELADLVRDPDFRERLRTMGRQSFGTQESPPTPPATPTGPGAMRTAAAVAEKAGAALTGGTDPASPDADSVHDELVAVVAASVGRAPDEQYRRDLLKTVRLASDPRAERYWQLMAIINGWPPIPSTMPAWGWFADALAARLGE
jgi:DNA-binding transcriptional MerR regulator